MRSGGVRLLVAWAEMLVEQESLVGGDLVGP